MLIAKDTNESSLRRQCHSRLQTQRCSQERFRQLASSMQGGRPSRYEACGANRRGQLNSLNDYEDTYEHVVEGVHQSLSGGQKRATRRSIARDMV